MTEPVPTPCDHEDATLVCADSERAVYWCAKCGNNLSLTCPPEPSK